MPIQTGQVCVLGAAPNWVLQRQNSLVCVSSWTWTSRPMMMSYGCRTHGTVLVCTGLRVCQSVACWNMPAARSSRSSCIGGPCNCRPMGSPPAVKPQGIEIPAIPARLRADRVQVPQVHRQRIVELVTQGVSGRGGARDRQ